MTPNEINVLRTVLIAPMTTKGINFPTRVAVTFQGKKGQIVLDQIRAVDKSRMTKKLGSLGRAVSTKILNTLQEMFAP